MEDGLRLDSRWAYSPKVDSCYARVTLDSTGRISNVVSRKGEPLRDAADLVGVLAGPPNGVHRELEPTRKPVTQRPKLVATKPLSRRLRLFDARKPRVRVRSPYPQQCLRDSNNG
jgi:hypothetical protein